MIIFILSTSLALGQMYMSPSSLSPMMLTQQDQEHLLKASLTSEYAPSFNLGEEELDCEVTTAFDPNLWECFEIDVRELAVEPLTCWVETDFSAFDCQEDKEDEWVCEEELQPSTSLGELMRAMGMGMGMSTTNQSTSFPDSSSGNEPQMPPMSSSSDQPINRKVISPEITTSMIISPSSTNVAGSSQSASTTQKTSGAHSLPYSPLLIISFIYLFA